MKNARIEMRSDDLSKSCKMGSCFLRENIASVFWRESIENRKQSIEIGFHIAIPMQKKGYFCILSIGIKNILLFRCSKFPKTEKKASKIDVGEPFR